MQHHDTRPGQIPAAHARRRGSLNRALFGLAFGTALATGCVPRARLVAARADVASESSGRRAAETRAAATEAERARLEQTTLELKAAAARRDAEFAALERELAEARLELENVSQQRAEAMMLVNQVREELSRVGAHLKEFSNEKRALGDALRAAEGKASELASEQRAAEERALLVRDLALALHDPLARREVELELEPGAAVLRVPAARLFNGDRLNARAAQLLKPLARVARLHQSQQIELRARGPADAKRRTTRLERLAAKLVSNGIAREQIVVPPSTEVSSASGAPTIELRISPRG